MFSLSIRALDIKGRAKMYVTKAKTRAEFQRNVVKKFSSDRLWRHLSKSPDTQWFFTTPATVREPAPPQRAEAFFLNRCLLFNLTDQETEVAKRLCEAKSDGLISTELNISTNTVNSHLKNIFVKLNVHSRAEAVKRLTTDH